MIMIKFPITVSIMITVDTFLHQNVIDQFLGGQEMEQPLTFSCLDNFWAICRTKRWMASKEYSRCILLYPRLLALQRAPLGLPAGGG